MDATLVSDLILLNSKPYNYQISENKFGFSNNVRGVSAPHRNRAILSFLVISKDYLAYLWG